MVDKYGPVLVELYNLLIKSPTNKRIIAFLQKLNKRLIFLEENLRINRADLEANESFQTGAIQAFMITLRIHQKEQITALVNAVINTVVYIDISDDFKYLFIDKINSLTSSHLYLLGFFQKKRLRILTLIPTKHYFKNT